jgi:hypothetical protein
MPESGFVAQRKLVYLRWQMPLRTVFKASVKVCPVEFGCDGIETHCNFSMF